MFKQILVLATVAIFSTSALAGTASMSEQQFQECMAMSYDMAATKKVQQQSSEAIDTIQRNLRALERKLDNLDFQYEIADAAYRGCMSANWGDCSQQARNVDYYADQYNATLDVYERVGKSEAKAIDRHNSRSRSWRRTENKYNRECIGVRVDTRIVEKYCSTNPNRFCKGFN